VDVHVVQRSTLLADRACYDLYPYSVPATTYGLGCANCCNQYITSSPPSPSCPCTDSLGPGALDALEDGIVANYCPWNVIRDLLSLCVEQLPHFFHQTNEKLLLAR
jgi:hypothetical protein